MFLYKKLHTKYVCAVEDPLTQPLSRKIITQFGLGFLLIVQASWKIGQ